MHILSRALGVGVLALVAVAASGCQGGRLVYIKYRGAETRLDVPLSTLREAAHATAEELVTEGEHWQLRSETNVTLRVVHEAPRHQTILDLTFYKDQEGASYQAEGYSNAMGSFWTFGITSTATQSMAKRKCEQFVASMRARAQGEE